MTLSSETAPVAFSDSMAAVAALLEQRTGQQIGAGRAWRVDTTLQPVLRELGFDSIDQLAAALAGGRNEALIDTVIDALLNQETSFFRDPGVFDMLADVLVQRQAEQGGRPLRLWSAGCSTGQEPLSIAMLLHERKLDVEIVASDVSAGAIARAKKGRYSQFEVQRGLSIHRMIAWFDGGTGGDWSAKRELVDPVQYRRHNLVAEPALRGGFDVILCRNIMLYFDPAIRRRVFEQLATALRPGGVLVLGASETVIGQTERFAPSERWRGFYRSA